MQEDPSSVFNQPEFKASLAKYEQMMQDGIRVYFEAEELTLIAEYYASIGDPTSSEEAIDYALSIHPENLDVQIFKCHSLFSRKKIQEAQQLLYSLPDQNDYEVKLLYIELALIQNDTGKAKRLFEQCYEDYPHIETSLDIAQLYMDYQMKSEAYPWLLKAYKEDPENPETIELMASFQYASENFDEAVKLFNRILDEFPYNVDAWLNLARCHIRMNQIEQAFEALDFALAIDDTNLIAWELKAHCYLEQGETEEAFKCFDYIESHTKDKGYIWNVLMYVHFDLGNFEQVLEYSKKLLEQYPMPENEFDWAEICYRRALACIYLNLADECAKAIIMGLAFNNHDYRLYLVKGELHLMYEEMEKARKNFKYAMQFSPTPKEALVGIAYAFFRTSYFDKALETYQELEQDYPAEAPFFYYFIAFCHFRLNQQEKMFKYLVRGAVYMPELLTNNKKEFPTGEDEAFFKLAFEIIRQIQQGKLDPSPYLDESK